MFICFYDYWHEVEYEVFQSKEALQSFLDKYKDDNHFYVVCLIQNRILYYLDPDVFGDYFLKAGDDDDNK